MTVGYRREALRRRCRRPRIFSTEPDGLADHDPSVLRSSLVIVRVRCAGSGLWRTNEREEGRGEGEVGGVGGGGVDV